MNLKLQSGLYSLVVFAVVFCASCSSVSVPTTSITDTWKDSTAANYKNIFVAVLTKNKEARTIMEDDIVKKLRKDGAKATRSLAVFSYKDNVDTPEEKRAAVEKIQGLGYDAIVTAVLIRKKEEGVYVPGTNSYAPANVGMGTGYYNPVTGLDAGSGQYGAFGVYYMNGSSAYSTPGYYDVHDVYFIHCSMFDAKTSKLIWRAKSETFFAGDLPKASGNFALVMTEAMKKAGLIHSKE